MGKVAFQPAEIGGYSMNKNYVSYKDFGAVGDGVTNDFFAMKAAHEYANENGLPVKAEAGKVYYVGNMEKDGVASPIPVKTDTDFCGAEIIIDDTDIAWCEGQNKNHNTHVFRIINDYEPVILPKDVLDKINAAGGIDKDNLKKIDTGLGYSALLMIEDFDKRNYIRYGYVNSGGPQRELAVVDENGNVDQGAPFLFSFAKVDKITAYRIDLKPIVIENAVITTRASRVNVVNRYCTIDRGIEIFRSNTTLRNIRHLVTGEYDKNELVNGVPFIGHSYNGFIRVQFVNNVLLDGVELQGRMHYLEGSYDFTASTSNKVVLKNCIQGNFFIEGTKKPNMRKYWGVAGTNFCKNLEYIGSRLTRYDAHCGVANGKIIDSEIAVIRLIGGGDFLIENTTFYCNQGPIQLRGDYGSTFNGTITVKDTTFLDEDDGILAIFTASSSNWDFGYTTYFPNLIVDNITIKTPNRRVELLWDFEAKLFSETNRYPSRSVTRDPVHRADARFQYVFNTVDEDGKPYTKVVDDDINHNVYVPPKFIKVVNSNDTEHDLVLYDVDFFENTEIITDENSLKIVPLPEKSRYLI